MNHHKPFPSTSTSLYLAFLAWILFMIYELGGSLSSSSTPWSGFFSLEPYLGRTRDWIENFLLALPGGILAGFAFNSKKKASSWILIWCFPLLLTAIGMEVCQRWIPYRNASFWDALWMSAGIVSGIIMGWQTKCVGREQLTLSKVNGLFLLWMAYPFIPAELQLTEADIYQALKVLVTAENFSISGVIWAIASWIIVAFFSPWQRCRALLMLLMLFTLLGSLTPQRVVLPEMVIGGGLAVFILAINRICDFSRLTLIFSLAMIAIALELTGSVTMHSQIPLFRFPLLTDLSNSRWLVCSSAAIEDDFLFLSLPWVIAGLTTDSKSTVRWMVSGGILIGMVTLLAVFFFSNAFSVTGILIYLSSGFLATRLGSSGLTVSLVPSSRSQSSTSTTRSITKNHPWLPLCCGIAVISLAMAAIVHLPGVPYNVRELFETRNLFLGATIFSVFLIWNVAAPGLLAGYLIKHPILHLIQPLLYLVMATGSWILLRFAVSAESLHDILGSPVWNWPSDWELYIRFLAFAYPFLWSLFSWNLLYQLLKRHQLWVSLIIWIIAIIIGIPLLFAAKFLVFDRAATDNVVELISNTPVLFALILLIAWNGVFVARRTKVLVATLVTAFSSVLSYGLLSTALYANAISFLLSPDRETLMSGAMLLLRWIVLYLSMTGFIVFGQSLSKPWVKRMNIAVKKADNTGDRA